MAYDAIIVGARVAGAATAMLMARAGYRVLVVDRATFPSDTISTHIIWQHGVSRLMQWGIGDRLIALNAPPIREMAFDFGPFALAGTPPAVNGVANAYAPRRTVLDKMLIDAAAEAGAEIREGFTVDELIPDGDRVTGIKGHTKSAPNIIEQARVVIGADGARSAVARAVAAPEYNVRPRLTCWYYSYWSGLRTDRVRFYSRSAHAFGCIPTNDNQVCIAVAWPNDRFATVKTDIEKHYMSAFDSCPAFKEEVLSGKREERFYGTADIPNYFRRPYGPGWALVGDAGYHKDPVLGQGISDAFRDAGLLASALNDVFTGRRDWDDALGSYEGRRNAAVEAIYAMNADFAGLEPPDPSTQMLLAALRGNEDDTSRFMGTFTGAVSPVEFYAPENVKRMLSAQMAHATA